MGKKIQKLTDDLERFIAYAKEGIDDRVADEIANAIVGEMLNLISKGISPIEGRGRFPAYKWANARKTLKESKAALNKELRRLKNSNIRRILAGKGARKELNRQKKALAKRIAATNKGYPYSVQGKYPDKKPRPVNLFLSGKFLSSLEFVISGSAGEIGVELGFFDESEAVKEQGHREGANGQPERPIIPVGREDFAISIQRIILKQMEDSLDRAFERGSKSF